MIWTKFCLFLWFNAKPLPREVMSSLHHLQKCMGCVSRSVQRINHLILSTARQNNTTKRGPRNSKVSGHKQHALVLPLWRQAILKTNNIAIAKDTFYCCCLPSQSCYVNVYLVAVLTGCLWTPSNTRLRIGSRLFLVNLHQKEHRVTAFAIGLLLAPSEFPSVAARSPGGSPKFRRGWCPRAPTGTKQSFPVYTGATWSRTAALSTGRVAYYAQCDRRF